jgi:hypothetical protein
LITDEKYNSSEVNVKSPGKKSQRAAVRTPALGANTVRCIRKESRMFIAMNRVQRRESAQRLVQDRHIGGL